MELYFPDESESADGLAVTIEDIMSLRLNLVESLAPVKERKILGPQLGKLASYST